MKTLSTIAVCLSLSLLSTNALAKTKLLVWESTDDSRNSIAQAVKDFETQYDCEVTIGTYDPIKQVEVIIDHLKTKEHAVPDVFTLLSDKVEIAVSNNIAMPLDFMKKDKDLYLNTATEVFKYKFDYYAAPRSIDTLVVYYNKDVLEYPFETFNEYIDYSKNAKKGTYGLLAKLDNFYFSYGILSGYGAYIFGINSDSTLNRDDIGLNFNDADKGVSFIADYARNCMPKEIMTDAGWGLMDDLFIQGKAAAVISGPWSLAKYAQSGVNYGIAPLPLLSNGKTPRPFLGVKGFAVNEASENKELATKLVQFLNQEKNALHRYEVSAELAPMKSVLSNPIILNDDFASAIAIQSENADHMPSIHEMNYVWLPMNDVLYQATHNSGTNTKALLDKAINEIKAQYK